MSMFRRVYSGAPWESKLQYCRALRARDTIFVSGTGPVAPDGTTFAPGDAYEQTRRCLEIIEEALTQLGSDRTCIARTRMYVTDMERFDEITRAHNEFFRGSPPATAIVEVRRLILPDMLIEIEAEAVDDFARH